MDKLDDATTELMTGEGDAVMLSLGDSFMECEEEFATEYCEQQQEARRLRGMSRLYYVCLNTTDRTSGLAAWIDTFSVSIQENGFAKAFLWALGMLFSCAVCPSTQFWPSLL